MLHHLASTDTSQMFPQIVPLITAIVVFGIFFMLLQKMVWPKILRGLEEREDKILTEIQQAEDAREQAKAAQAEYEQSLAQAREEAGETIARAKADAKATADDILARSKAQLEEQQQRARQSIESAKQAAVNELYAQAATLAAAVAAKILEREISAEDQQRLVEESLRELGQVSNN
jgi:F-type H+-transporting ATPase subunit b